jgi:hypothetical protein
MARKAGKGLNSTNTIALLEKWLHTTDAFYAGYTGFDLILRHTSRQTAVSIVVVPTGTPPPVSTPPPSRRGHHVDCPKTCKVCCVVRNLLHLYRHGAEETTMVPYKSFADALTALREPLKTAAAHGDTVRGLWRGDAATPERWTEAFPAYFGVEHFIEQANALLDNAALLQPLIHNLATSPDVRRAPEEGRTPGLLLDEIVRDLEQAGFTPRDLAELVDDGAGGSAKARAQRIRVRLNKA